MKTSLLILLATLGLALGAAASAQPLVVASIRPLQLIAAAVTGEVSEPSLLMPASASPHHHALRPSERRLLQEAEVLLWVGPELEIFLTEVVAELGAAEIRAGALPGLTRRQVGAGLDPHLWLDPANAAVLAAALAERLGRLDPPNAAAYRANLRDFESALEAVDGEIRAAFRNAGPPAPYAVFHDAFQYFEARYGLAHVTAFTLNEEAMPGLRRLLEIREELAAAGVGCILVEPGVNVAELRNVVEIEAMRYVEVDVLGHDQSLSAEGYPALLRAIAGSLLDCVR